MGTKKPRATLVREDVLRKAAAVFAEKGFASANLQDIADAVGLSRPALYYYFKNKDEVLAALVEEATTYPVSVLEKYRRDKDLTATERLRKAMSELILWVLQSPYPVRVLESNEAELPVEVSEQHAKAKRRVLRAFVDLIEDGIAAGEFAAGDSQLAAFALIGMSNWTAWWYRPEGELPPTEVATVFADIAVRSVRLGDGKSRGGNDVRQALRALKEDISHLERVLEFQQQRQS